MCAVRSVKHRRSSCAAIKTQLNGCSVRLLLRNVSATAAAVAAAAAVVAIGSHAHVSAAALLRLCLPLLTVCALWSGPANKIEKKKIGSRNAKRHRCWEQATASATTKSQQRLQKRYIYMYL